MLFALSAASALLDGLQLLTSSASNSSSTAQGATPFDPLAGLSPPPGATAPAPAAGGRQLSSQTLSTLFGLQGSAGSSGAAAAATDADADADGSAALSTQGASTAQGATSVYHQIELLMQQQAQAMSMQAGAALSLAA